MPVLTLVKMLRVAPLPLRGTSIDLDDGSAPSTIALVRPRDLRPMLTGLAAFLMQEQWYQAA